MASSRLAQYMGFYLLNCKRTLQSKMVEMIGLEPTTFTVQMWRSPSWATPPTTCWLLQSERNLILSFFPVKPFFYFFLVFFCFFFQNSMNDLYLGTKMKKVLFLSFALLICFSCKQGNKIIFRNTRLNKIRNAERSFWINGTCGPIRPVGWWQSRDYRL